MSLLERRVRAIGRNSYIRAYPNPGLAVTLGRYRVGLSWHGGLEVFRGGRRVYALLSRVRRPGGKV